MRLSTPQPASSTLQHTGVSCQLGVGRTQWGISVGAWGSHPIASQACQVAACTPLALCLEAPSLLASGGATLGSAHAADFDNEARSPAPILLT